MMPDYPTLAARLTGQPDLYTALMGLGPAELAPLLAACDADVAARLQSVDQRLLRAILRAGAGGEAVTGAGALRDHLATVDVAPMFAPAIMDGPSIALPTAGQIADMPAFSDRAFDTWFTAQNVPYGIGLYGEHRHVYATPQFADRASVERRTVHMGIDVFAPAGTPVHAPLAGVVRSVVYNADPLDYGHTLILQHDGPAPFYTLYGHMGATLPGLCAVGDRVTPGQIIAHFGDWHENGGWAPHMHFQVMSTMLDQNDGNFFGVGHKGLWPVWSQICPDPNLILRLDAGRFL
jgi:hypothetical protein